MICRKCVRPGRLLDRDMVPTLSPCLEYGFPKHVRHLLIHDIMWLAAQKVPTNQEAPQAEATLTAAFHPFPPLAAA